MLKQVTAAMLAAAVCACAEGSGQDAPPAAEVAAVAEIAAPAGEYRLDPSHASILVRADHFGLSHYTLRFTRFDVTLQLDPEDPTRSSVTATIDPASIETDSPPTRADLVGELRTSEWLNVAAHPEIAFRSTAITLTGADTATMRGDLTFLGVTRPVDVFVTFNQSFAGDPYSPTGPSRLGVSATGAIRRSDFGLTNFLPTEEWPVAVGDEIDIVMELEFTGPAAPAANSSAPA
ncbi:MAG: YceI family protein [Hyphomonadaceae bacterium]